MLIKETDKAPQFDLPTDSGDNFSLIDNLGKPIVLFFYPKDDTKGCTQEAIEFTAAKPEFDKLGIVLVGMSPDPEKKHVKFKAKHELDIILVSDEEKTALQAYNVWVEKSMYGRKYMGVERSTFLIDGKGVIVKAWRKVKVPGHVDIVLEAARQL